MDNTTKRLTTKELNELKRVLNSFETRTVRDTGVDHISGGFAKADMADYNDDKIYIELKWGIQSDCENTVHTENWELDRKTMNSKITLKEKVAQIRD